MLLANFPGFWRVTMTDQVIIKNSDCKLEYRHGSRTGSARRSCFKIDFGCKKRESLVSSRPSRPLAKLIWTFIIPHFKISLHFWALSIPFSHGETPLRHFSITLKRKNNKKSCVGQGWAREEKERVWGKWEALHFWSYHKNERNSPRKLSHWVQQEERGGRRMEVKLKFCTESPLLSIFPAFRQDLQSTPSQPISTWRINSELDG